MTGRVLVSVIVPTHDRAGLVSRAVRSVLAQTVDDLEVIVVDDGSVDGTDEVLADLVARDGRVRPFRLPTAAGAPAARNRGLAEARGELVAFLDDDDEWLPTKLERQIASLRAVPGAVVVGCQHVEVDDAGRAVAHRGPTSIDAGALLWSNFLGSASLGMVRRAAFPAGLPTFDESLPSCQDWDYWIRCLAAGPAVVVPEVLCRYAATSAPRLTNDRRKRVDGHRRILERHGARMSADCRSFLQARLRLLEAPSQARELLLGPRLLVSTRPRALWALANEIAAARLGARQGDPARGSRRLHQILEGPR